jgi:hypothetical protein
MLLLTLSVTCKPFKLSVVMMNVVAHMTCMTTTEEVGKIVTVFIVGFIKDIVD